MRGTLSPNEDIELCIELSDESGDFGARVSFIGRWVPEARYHDEQQCYIPEVDSEVLIENYWRTVTLNTHQKTLDKTRDKQILDYLLDYFEAETKEKLE